MEDEFVDISEILVNPLIDSVSPADELVDISTLRRFTGKQSEQIGNRDLSKSPDAINPFINSNIPEIQATNQEWGQTMLNSISQLLTGTIGEIVSTPGYIAGMFEPIEEMDRGISGLFLDAGKAISEAGQEFAPIHQSQASREKVFAPRDRDWETYQQYSPE